jgi:hypothetical protein
VVATATADVNADVSVEIRLPLPALPLGPGPLYPLDSYGPRPDGNAVLRWGEQTLSAIRALKTGPTINARALAIVHTAMYDAWVSYDAAAVDSRGRLRADPTLRRPAAAQRRLQEPGRQLRRPPGAAQRVPGRGERLPGLMSAVGYDPDDASTDPASPTGVGNQAAAAVLATAPTTGPTRRTATPTPPATSQSTPPIRSTTRSAGSRCALSTPAATPWSRST